MGYLEIRRIFEFLRNFNMMIWSLGHKESVLELITLQLTQGLELYTFMRESIGKQERLEELRKQQVDSKAAL